jgi:hypothetical protein
MWVLAGQAVELDLLCNQEVAGSNPVMSTGESAGQRTSNGLFGSNERLLDQLKSANSQHLKKTGVG